MLSMLFFFKPLETALVLQGRNPRIRSECRQVPTHPAHPAKRLPADKQPLQIFSQCVMRTCVTI